MWCERNERNKAGVQRTDRKASFCSKWFLTWRLLEKTALDLYKIRQNISFYYTPLFAQILLEIPLLSSSNSETLYTLKRSLQTFFHGYGKHHVSVTETIVVVICGSMSEQKEYHAMSGRSHWLNFHCTLQNPSYFIICDMPMVLVGSVWSTYKSENHTSIHTIFAHYFWLLYI
jgi:hypothetical protein